MKFALYQPWIYLHGGLERSLLELVTRSRHEWTVYTGHYEPENTFSGFRDVDVRVVGHTTVNRSIKGVLTSVLNVALQRLPLEPQVRGLVVWCDGVGDMITFRNRALPLFNICSTPLRPVFDPVYSSMAKNHRGLLGRLAFSLFSHTFKVVDRLAWRRYRGVFATSREVRNRILAGRLHDGGKDMIMAYPGIEWSASPDVRYEPFILLPGRIMWTKNIQQGIEAFLMARLPAPWKLVVAGFVDRKSRVYLEELQRISGSEGRVEFVVSPDDEQLNDLYRRCAFCLFTPLNEDWGIVPLESMAHAKPVIATARGGPLESVIDGSTGFLHEPDDLAGWSRSIAALATDRERLLAMGAAALQHVKRYRWEEFVRTIDDALEAWVVEGAVSSANSGDSMSSEDRRFNPAP